MVVIASPQHTARAADALSLHRYLIRLTNAAFGAFLWVFIFQYFALFAPLGGALVRTLLLYALTQTIALLLIPFGMRRLRASMRRGIVWGSVLLLISLVYVGMLLAGLFPHGAAVIGLLIGAERALYRTPYTLERARLRGKNPKLLVGELLLACAPFLIGAMLFSGMPPFTLFFLIALVSALALLPLTHVPDVYELFSWGYRETFDELIIPANRRLLAESLYRGALSGCLFLLWPLALFLALDSYLALGAIFSATLLIIMLVRKSRARALVWHRADAGSYLDEFTALKEMGLALGSLTVALVSALVIAAF